MSSDLTFYGGDIADGSAATPGLWDRRFSTISQNLDEVHAQPGTSFNSFAGTDNQISIDTTTSANTAIWSLPNDLRAPGSLLVTSETSLNSSLTVSGDVLLQSDLSVDGVSKFSYIEINDGFTSTQTKEITWTDVGEGTASMGFYRSINSATLRFSGGTFRTETMLDAAGADGIGTSVEGLINIRTGRHFVAKTEGASSNSGGFHINSIDGLGAAFVQDSLEIYNSGFRIKAGIPSAPPQLTFFGVTSRGTVLIGSNSSNLIANSSFALQLRGPTIFRGDIDLNTARLFSINTVASGDSLNMNAEEPRFIIAGASGASIGIRSGGTIYYFDSSSSTVG